MINSMFILLLIIFSRTKAFIDTYSSFNVILSISSKIFSILNNEYGLPLNLANKSFKELKWFLSKSVGNIIFNSSKYNFSFGFILKTS